MAMNFLVYFLIEKLKLNGKLELTKETGEALIADILKLDKTITELRAENKELRAHRDGSV
jgi:cell division protein FtsB